MNTGALEDDDRNSMGLVTDRAEWKPILATLASEGIPASAATIQQEHRWDQEAVRYFMGPHVTIEIRDDKTWDMDKTERATLETKLRAAAPPEWNGSDLVIVWRRPVASEWAAAWLDGIDRLWRDWRRRRITDGAFEDAREALSVLHRRVWDQAEDHGPLLPNGRGAQCHRGEALDVACTGLSRSLAQARRRGSFKGEAPRPIELARAPLLENWRANHVSSGSKVPHT
ncbi:hypothetical protein V1280_004425 [Bradyrhizobium sp. AZCC 2230]